MTSPIGTVFVFAPARNIADSRPVFGECELIAVYPNHACGPSVEIRDEFGVTMVLERYTIPLWIRQRTSEGMEQQ